MEIEQPSSDIFVNRSYNGAFKFLPVKAASGVPRCGVRLSDMITSVVLLLCARHGTDESQANGIQGSYFLTDFHNLVHAIVRLYKPPIVKRPIFQYTGDNVCRVLVRLEPLLVYVPKTNRGKLLDESLIIYHYAAKVQKK